MIDAIDEMIEEKRKEKSKNSEMVEISNALGVDIIYINEEENVNISLQKAYKGYSVNEAANSELLPVNIKDDNIFTKYNLSFHNCSFGGFMLYGKQNVKCLNFNNCKLGSINLQKGSYEKVDFIKCDATSLSLRDCKFKDNFTFDANHVNIDEIELFNCNFGISANIKANKIKEISARDYFSVTGNVIEGDIYIQSIEAIEKASFKYTTFGNKCCFGKTTFKELDLSHCVFNGDADFSGCKFGTEVDAAKTIDLSSITFNGDANFDKSYFNYFVAFHMSSFNGTASFYKCHFNTIPNFSPADFKGILNINNASWGENDENFDFEKVKELVENAYKNESESNDPMENVKNIRNSFSGMKHKLIEQDNLLEAQDFHKAELYCKEIELKNEKSKGMKEWVNWGLLCFYKHISEHHTDLNKIFHITLMVIVSYGVSLLALDFLPICSTNVFVGFLITCVCFLCFIAILYILYDIKNNCVNRAIRYSIYTGIFTILLCEPQILNPVLGISQSDEYKNAKLNEVMDNSSYANLLETAKDITNKNISIQSPRAVIIENKKMLENFNDISTNLHIFKQAIRQDYVIYATRQSMSVIYIILLILCIFSLQKTARKNTIVPS